MPAPDDVIDKPPAGPPDVSGDAFIKKLLEGAPDLLPEDEDAPEKAPKWRNRYRWRHPTRTLPRPDGQPVPPGGEFCTRTLYASAKEAKAAADAQLYGFGVKAWPMQLRPLLQYLGPVPVAVD